MQDVNFLLRTNKQPDTTMPRNNANKDRNFILYNHKNRYNEHQKTNQQQQPTNNTKKQKNKNDTAIGNRKYKTGENLKINN